MAYASRTLNYLEKKYAATEREALALVWAVKHFHPYLFGRTFTLVSDHAALRFLKTQGEANARLQRWSLTLQEYSYDVIHKAGKYHLDADALSRAPPPPAEMP